MSKIKKGIIAVAVVASITAIWYKITTPRVYLSRNTNDDDFDDDYGWDGYMERDKEKESATIKKAVDNRKKSLDDEINDISEEMKNTTDVIRKTSKNDIEI